ncbi:MAG: two-component system phosphate regulon sensor histidine kinase PhoR, partial [Roseivirga sp.]
AYAVFALSSLTDDERELEIIYERQLEAVLFSINQYTQDVVGGIATKIDNAYQFGAKDKINEMLSPYKFFRALDIKNVAGETVQFYASDSTFINAEFRSKSDSIFSISKELISRLERYKENYQKIESRDFIITHNKKDLGVIQFAIGLGDDIKICTYYFSGDTFIFQVLARKIQEISRGEFIILCRRTDSKEVVYANIEVNGQETDVRSEIIDLLPQYEVGISRAGNTVSSIVTKRKYQNLSALILLMLFLLSGVVLVVRNIKKEIDLAQSKADFVSNVSHEIRTPLALINMFAETLLMGRVNSEEKKKEYYQIITKEVGRLTNMINRILSFSRIEAEKREYHRASLELNEVILEVNNTYSYHLESHGFTHSFIPENLLPLISADKEAIVEVLVNLIDNAMKYSKEVKEVVITTGQVDGNVFIQVEDKGIGIPKGQLDKLFDKFYRVPTGDVHDTKGSGLGLSIVKHIMEAHGGIIRVQSSVGEGSTFRLLFPILKSEA